MSAGPRAENVRAAAEALSAWFAANQRELPWRRPYAGSGFAGGMLAEAPAQSGASATTAIKTPPRRDPYRTWISEIMLQQTQVATVIGYFNRWMERFPDVDSLARAQESEVLEAWAGLGYYSRARNVLVTAREVSARGGFPSSREELLGLKGIGEYTAGAIASLAFDLPEPILDGNLVRVFSRVYGMDFLPDAKEQKAAYWDIARAWALAHKPGLVNEGLMELGALVCSPRNPACDACPLAAFCSARAAGSQDRLPPAKARKQSVDVEGYVVAAFRLGAAGLEVLLYTPGKEERLAGLLTFPIFDAGDLPGLRTAWKSALPGLASAAAGPSSPTVSRIIAIGCAWRKRAWARGKAARICPPAIPGPRPERCIDYW